MKSKLPELKGIIVIAILCCPFLLKAQREIVFSNPASGKVILAHPGDQLALVYKGYLGREELFKQMIFDITDSSVFLGIDPSIFPAAFTKDPRKHGRVYKEILFRDVISFRRISAARSLLKASLTTGAAVGSIFLLNSLYKSSTMSDLTRIGISLGVAFGSAIIINAIFPEKPRYLVEDGWSIKSR